MDTDDWMESPRSATLGLRLSNGLAEPESCKFREWNIATEKDAEMRFKDGIQRYCIAIVSTLAATQIRLWIDPWVGDHVPFGTYMVAVVLTAWIA